MCSSFICLFVLYVVFFERALKIKTVRPKQEIQQAHAYKTVIIVIGHYVLFFDDNLLEQSGMSFNELFSCLIFSSSYIALDIFGICAIFFECKDRKTFILLFNSLYALKILSIKGKIHLEISRIYRTFEDPCSFGQVLL